MKRLFFLVLLGSLAGMAWSQPMKSIEFRDQSIRDILLSLGELNDASIVPDETVDGKASYVFSDMDFKQALQVFLDTFKLSSTFKNNVYYVSRVFVAQNPDNTLDVRASDVPLKSILRVVSNQIGKTILYDNLPNDPFTINVQKAKIEDVLGITIARYPDFTLETKDKYFYLRNKAQSTNSNGLPTSTDAIIANGDSYDLKITHSRFKDLLSSLFTTGKKEFVLLLDKDVIIDSLFLKGLSFDEALKQLLLQVNADFKVDQDVYYIYEVQRKDLLKKYLTNVIVPFRYISSADFTKLLPPNLNSGTFFRLDEKGNKVILSGSLEEIKPIWDFIDLIDRDNPGNVTLRVDLKYAKTDDVIPLLPADLAGFVPVPLSNKTSLLVSLPEPKKQAFLNFIQLVDQPIPETPIHLRYMKADDLVAKLPPSVTDANVIKSNDQTLVFFKGSPELLRVFKKDLEQIDIPKPLLRYEILVLQFEEGTTLSYQPTFTVQGGDTGNSFTGQFSPALNMNFDLVGNFGASFVVGLSAAITDNKAKVAADTTLNGLSGEKVTFQNTTSTYYAANEISTSGTATVVGSVNQLSTGLILTLQGWISSDKMVTLQVDTTLSNASASTSSTSTTSSSSSTSSTTLPPNTTEKKLSTQVRMLSGQPLVIGGLKEDEKTSTVNKTPFLGDIPLLGLLFQGVSNTVDHTEFTIYIVPILDNPDEQAMSQDARMLSYYHRFQKDNG